MIAFKSHQKAGTETINRYIIQALEIKKSELAQILNTTKPTIYHSTFNRKWKMDLSWHKSVRLNRLTFFQVPEKSEFLKKSDFGSRH